ncbi:MAG: PIG-L deacetylase family protein [Saprospiraceae bacterium]
MKLPYKKALILAPHTDDGEFGCGGTISRLIREGCEVMYVAFSDCKESVPDGFPKDILQSEMKAATAVLKIKPDHVKILDYKVRYFPSERQRILEDLVKINKEYNPDVVFTPSRQDVHQDHSTITNECIRAFKSKSIYGYELPWNNLNLPSNCIIKLEEEDIKNKIMAIQMYKSQFGRTYSSTEYQNSLALTRGTRIGTNYAEAFDLIRIIH